MASAFGPRSNNNTENNTKNNAHAIKPVLTREVLTPGREQTGIAVVLVAASALAFALAGSAFALWARSAAHCEHRHAAPPVALDADQSALNTETAFEPCTAQLVEYKGVSYYRLCPEPDVAIQPAHEVVIEEQEGMVVYRIVK